MLIKVSIGEIVDKLSILQIKKSNINEESKLKNITYEFDYLHDIVFNKLQIETTDYLKLVDVNKQLWDIEDSIRVKEFKKEFDDVFVSLARNVYIINDKRATIKKNINIKYSSELIEEKSYKQHESTN